MRKVRGRSFGWNGEWSRQIIVDCAVIMAVVGCDRDDPGLRGGRKKVEYEIHRDNREPFAPSVWNIFRKYVAEKRAYWNTVVRFPGVFYRLAIDRWVLQKRVKGTVRNTRVISTRDLICAQYTSQHKYDSDS